MKAILQTVGGMLLLAGVIFFLQGINLLPGSFMTGQSFWAWAGIMCLIVGLMVLLAGVARARGESR